MLLRLYILLIFVSGAVSLAHAAGACDRVRYSGAPCTLADSALSIPLGGSGLSVSSMMVEARVSMKKVREKSGMASEWWGVSLHTPGDTLCVALRFGNTDFGDILDRRIAVVRVSRNGSVVAEREVNGFNTSGGACNSLSVALSGGSLSVGGGGHGSSLLLSLPLAGAFEPEEASVWCVGSVTVHMLVAEICHPPGEMLASGFTMESLRERFRNSGDLIEGFWTYFDRENDPAYARLGGEYTLAVVRRGDTAPPVYDIIYIDGAQTSAGSWSPMMLKGSLRPAIFDGHYDMEWIDSSFRRITHDINALLDENASLLTLRFPMLRTVIRFSRLPL